MKLRLLLRAATSSQSILVGEFIPRATYDSELHQPISLRVMPIASADENDRTESRLTRAEGRAKGIITPADGGTREAGAEGLRKEEASGRPLLHTQRS